VIPLVLLHVIISVIPLELQCLKTFSSYVGNVWLGVLSRYISTSFPFLLAREHAIKAPCVVSESLDVDEGLLLVLLAA
jgi:hypothetical protein